MSSRGKPIAVYGASGHTGRFVIQEALHQGLAVVAVGREAGRLALNVPAGVPLRVASIADPQALERAFAGCSVVINCAGPFLDTASPVALAALRAGCHYLDVTAEQASARATFTDLDEPAQAAGLAVIPAAGFFGGLADLLATAVASEGPVDEVTVAIALDHWWPTEGTRRTGERNQVPRVVLQGGRLCPLQPSPEDLEWTFSPPIGRQSMVPLPFSEIITMSRHLPAGEIRSFLNRSALQEVRDGATPPPTASDPSGRSAQRFEIVVQVRQDGTLRMAGARGQDIYASTAPLVVEAAVRILNPTFGRCGTLALAQAFDAVGLLEALDGRDLEVFGITTVGRAQSSACARARLKLPMPFVRRAPRRLRS